MLETGDVHPAQDHPLQEVQATLLQLRRSLPGMPCKDAARLGWSRHPHLLRADRHRRYRMDNFHSVQTDGLPVRQCGCAVSIFHPAPFSARCHGWQPRRSAVKMRMKAPIRRPIRARSEAYFLPKNAFRFFSPFTAMSLRFGSIFRQMAAARAITFTSVVKLSITTSPLYLIFRSAFTIGFQSM